LYFWGECVLSAAHIINRIPTPTLSNKTPYDCLFSTPPSFSHLRVIGCLCFVSTISRNCSKFDPRAKSYVLVGYPYNIKGYKLFDLSSHTLIVSRDVIFHKDVFPYHAHFKSSYPQNIIIWFYLILYLIVLILISFIPHLHLLIQISLNLLLFLLLLPILFLPPILILIMFNLFASLHGSNTNLVTYINFIVKWLLLFTFLQFLQLF